MTKNVEIIKQLSSLSKQLNLTLEQQQREEVFAESANARFEKNLTCFEKYYPEIAKEIKKFQVRSDFCIHVTTSGHGNFVTKGNCTPLYSDDPIEQVTKQVDFAVAKPTFTLTEYEHYPKKSKDLRLHIEYMMKLGIKLTDIRESMDLKPLKTLPDRFSSAVIFGIGLGYHLPLLFNKTQFDYLFVIEPDFEQFFASLFCTNWYKIIEKIDEQGGCLFLFLGITAEDLVADFKKITEDIGAFSLVRSFCYQHSPMPEINSLITNFFKEYFQFQFGHGFYNDAVTGLSHSFHHLKNNIPFYTANKKTIHELRDLPVFVVGNGPSLDEAREFLVENQNNAIIFACGTALTSLIKMGITPDFHILVERPYRNYQAVLDMASKEVYSKLNLLAVNTIYPDTTELYAWSGLALKGNEAGTDFINIQRYLSKQSTLTATSFSNPLVANTGLSFALHFGFSDVYLFGVDNGSILGGRHHSQYSIYDDSHKGKYKYVPQKTGGSYLKGNLGEEVETNNLYKVSNQQLKELVKLFTATIYNVGNGAFIDGCIPVEPSTLLPLPDVEKSCFVDLIKASFDNIGLDQIDESALAMDKIMSAFDHLLSIASEPIDDIHDAAEVLKRQQRYLYAYRSSIYSHIFHIIKGSLLYYHCPMVTSLFKYDNKTDCLNVYRSLNSLWLSYLTDMKNHCEAHLFEKCDWEFY